MEQQEQLLLEPLLSETKVSRRTLLPMWIKVFTWIFMITGALAALGLIAGIFGINFQIALYGLESNDPHSPAGLFISLLFVLKGIVAFGLWTEKDWAVNLGIADAMAGIAVCCFIMFVSPFMNQTSGFTFNLRLELVALIPYLVKLRRINPAWKLN